MFKKKDVLKFILGLKVKQLRLRRGLSLKDLADRSDFSISYLNEIENGKKYPKIEKLHSLAEGLEIEVGELVSFKTGRSLHPLLKFIENGNISNIPLELFGISQNDALALMSQSPEKFASFVLTILQLARAFDVKLDDVYQSALCSYIESNENYFPEIEERASKFLADIQGDLTFERIKDCLQIKFSRSIDENSLEHYDDLKFEKVIVRPNAPYTIYLNKRLNKEEKKFILLKEAGKLMLELENKNDFTIKLIDYTSTYFAAACMLEEKRLCKNLEIFFECSTFQLQLIEPLACGLPRVLFYRLTQILPAHFKVHELFFLEVKEQRDGKIAIKSELHLSQLHGPHAVRTNETYCRRWVAIRSLNEYDGIKGVHTAVQKSIVEDGKEYFSLSMAYLDSVENEKHSVTIGFLINDELKKHIRFLSDEINLQRTAIAQTCERCSKMDCKERKAPPQIYQAQVRKQNLEHSINSFLS